MDVKQRADDALGLLAGWEQTALADLRGELARAGDAASLKAMDGFREILAEFKGLLGKLTGRVPAAPPAPPPPPPVPPVPAPAPVPAAPSAPPKAVAAAARPPAPAKPAGA